MSFTFVQQSDNNFGTAGGSPVTFSPASITAGNLVIVSVSAGGGITSIDSVTDSLGNTYTPVLGSQVWHTSGTWVDRTFYSNATTGGASPTLTVNFTGTSTQFRMVSVSEYSFNGGTHATPDGASSVGIQSNTASPANSGSIVTTGTDLLYGFGDWSTVVLSAPAGWTARNPTQATTFDFLNQASGTYSFQPTYTGSQTWSALIVAFKETSSIGMSSTFLSVLGVG